MNKQKEGLCLSSINVKGIEYELVDAANRRAIVGLIDDIKKLTATMETYKQGILEIANHVTKLKQNETTKRTNFLVEASSSFPVLKIEGDFSILVDISLSVEDDDSLFTSQQIIKSFNGKIYHSNLDNNCTIDCYHHLLDNTHYILFDTLYKKYNLSMNVMSFDGDVPVFIIDENKVAIKKYPNVTKLN